MVPKPEPKPEPLLPRCDECARTFETCGCTTRYAARNPKQSWPTLPIDKQTLMRRLGAA